MTFTIAGKEVEVSTGDLAFLSPGSILIKAGGTSLLANVTVDKKDTEQDFFPLGVEYIEKMYARGAMSGSKFKKREGLPSDEAIIKAREVDHSIRSLFPKSFRRPVLVVLTVLSYDGINDPQSLTVLGASLALLQSGVPFEGPCASVVSVIDSEGNIIINPPAEDREKYEAEWILSAVDGKVLSLEGWGKETSNELMDKVLDISLEEIKKINEQQIAFINKVGKSLDIDASNYSNLPSPLEVINFVKEHKLSEVKNFMFGDKTERNENIDHVKTEIKEIVENSIKEGTISEENSKLFTSHNINEAVDYIARAVLREAILNENKRVSGRGLTEIRELKASVDILPTVHGSALFSRGETQSLSITTLAPKSFALIIDDMEGEESRHFMHHYNFPPFSTGEADRYKYHPGRREIGHGAIGENALKHIIASIDEFPYTIRAVSEILSSNGSTSMAATCASSMALMASGVPMKSAVAGIGVGLITEDENEDNYKLLLDIEGIEDFYGDMDFKVCGTKDGITAIQYENKLQGVKPNVLKEAFRLAEKGRFQVLEVMNSAISESRSTLPSNAPVVDTLKIEKEEIGELIGPGGKNIKALTEKACEYGETPDIAIDQDGTVTISGSNSKQLEFIKKQINFMFLKPIVGSIYEGEIDGVTDFGAFVNISPKITGLIHKSNMADKFVSKPEELVKKGQKVKVKLISIEKGKQGFSMKGIDQPVENI